jgi:hypothetical protein
MTGTAVMHGKEEQSYAVREAMMPALLGCGDRDCSTIIIP